MDRIQVKKYPNINTESSGIHCIQDHKYSTFQWTFTGRAFANTNAAQGNRRL